jgi:uncharacterized membrane protein HdeD (DUF308 family)
MLEQKIITNWWGLLLRGLIAILFGILTMAVPGLTLRVLVVFFGVYCLIDGCVNIVSSIRARHGQPRWWILLLHGLASIGAGVIALVWPGITALALVFVIAIWAIATGALEIAAAIHLRKQIKGEWLLGLCGVLSIVFGFLLLTGPAAGALAVVYWIALWAIFWGVATMALAVRLRVSAGAPPWPPVFTGPPATP